MHPMFSLNMKCLRNFSFLTSARTLFVRCTVNISFFFFVHFAPFFRRVLFSDFSHSLHLLFGGTRWMSKSRSTQHSQIHRVTFSFHFFFAERSFHWCECGVDVHFISLILFLVLSVQHFYTREHDPLSFGEFSELNRSRRAIPTTSAAAAAAASTMTTTTNP